MARRLPVALLALALAACGGVRDCGRSADELAQEGIERARAGALDDAIAAFESSLLRDPDNLKALYNLGLAQLLRGHGPKAVDALSAFVRLRPDDAQGRFELARAWAISGRRQEALEELRRAVDLGFADHEALVRGGGFQALYSDPRFVALEMVVAQRAGHLADGGSLGRVEGTGYGGIPVDVTLPGIRGRGEGAACTGD